MLLYPIISYHIRSYQIISYHILSDPIISYHILSYTTLNKSLLVSTNEGRTMREENRLKLSTINKVYLYEIKDNVILSGP
jgi:hypothetical protein